VATATRGQSQDRGQTVPDPAPVAVVGYRVQVLPQVTDLVGVDPRDPLGQHGQRGRFGVGQVGELAGSRAG
jgi:hypothetical protein